MSFPGCTRSSHLALAVTALVGLGLGGVLAYRSMLSVTALETGQHQLLILVGPALVGAALVASSIVMLFRRRVGLAMYFSAIALGIASVVLEFVSGRMLQMQVGGDPLSVFSDVSIDGDPISAFVSLGVLLALIVLGVWAGTKKGPTAHVAS